MSIGLNSVMTGIANAMVARNICVVPVSVVPVGYSSPGSIDVRFEHLPTIDVSSGHPTLVGLKGIKRAPLPSLFVQMDSVTGRQNHKATNADEYKYLNYAKRHILQLAEQVRTDGKNLSGDEFLKKADMLFGGIELAIEEGFSSIDIAINCHFRSAFYLYLFPEHMRPGDAANRFYSGAEFLFDRVKQEQIFQISEFEIAAIFAELAANLCKIIENNFPPHTSGEMLNNLSSRECYRLSSDAWKWANMTHKESYPLARAIYHAFTVDDYAMMAVASGTAAMYLQPSNSLLDSKISDYCLRHVFWSGMSAVRKMQRNEDFQNDLNAMVVSLFNAADVEKDLNMNPHDLELLAKDVKKILSANSSG